MITKENYLSYFLLYIDKELTADKAEMVKTFAASNELYKMELQQLMLATLKPQEEIFVSNKSIIFKPALIIVDGINEQNYEMYFSAYLDNELNKAEQTALENFLYKNPLLKAELEIWQKCKLNEPLLVFNHKNLLYKKTAKKPLFLYFKPLAAAAILFLSLGLFWVYNSNLNGETSAVSSNVVLPTNTVTAEVPTKQNDNLDANVDSQNNIKTNNENRKENAATLVQNVNNKALNNFYKKDSNNIKVKKEFKESMAVSDINQDALTLAESNIVKQQIFIEKNNAFVVTNFNLNRNTYSGTITIENEMRDDIVNAKFKEEENDSEVLVAGQKIETKKRTTIFGKIRNLKNKLNDDMPIKIGKKYIIL